MDLYASFLGALSVLFVASAAILMAMSLFRFGRHHVRKAVIYLALALLALLVAAGFLFFRGLMTP